eukprot:Opistho-1_new@92947
MKGARAAPVRRKRKKRDGSSSPPPSLPSSTGFGTDALDIDDFSDDDAFTLHPARRAAPARADTRRLPKNGADVPLTDGAGDAPKLGRTLSSASLFSTARPFFVPSTGRYVPDPSPAVPGGVASSHVGTSLGMSLQEAPPESVLWADAAAPETEDDLAVSKKKVDELKGWLSVVFAAQDAGFRGPHVPPRILLLTGPPGSGKTAALSVAARVMDFDVVEWINPVRPAFRPSEAWTPGQESDYVPLLKEFRDFLLRCERYPSVAVSSASTAGPSAPPTSSVLVGAPARGRKVIVVEDLPNVLPGPQARSFQDTIRQMAQTGRYPLVFIASDWGESDIKRLFPLDMPIARIAFNPVARTSLEKALLRVATAHHAANPASHIMPDKDTLKRMAEAACGDVRAAVNALQFACVRDYERRKHAVVTAGAGKAGGKGKGKSRKAKAADAGEPIGDADYASRDVSITLFHALGKMLYAKRDMEGPTDAELLPPSSSHLARRKLLVDPEDAIARTAVTGETFTSFLHENYLDFFSDIDSTLIPCDGFSDADILSSAWKERDTLSLYAASVSARSILFASDSSQPKGKWRPLRRSQWTVVAQRGRDNAESIEQLFHGGPEGAAVTPMHRHAAVDLRVEVLPYLRLTRTRLNDYQSRFLGSFLPYARDGRFGGPLDILDEDGKVEDEVAPSLSAVVRETSEVQQLQADTSSAPLTQPPLVSPPSDAAGANVDGEDDEFGDGAGDDFDDPALLAAALLADDELERLAAAADGPSSGDGQSHAYAVDDDIEEF